MAIFNGREALLDAELATWSITELYFLTKGIGFNLVKKIKSKTYASINKTRPATNKRQIFITGKSVSDPVDSTKDNMEQKTAIGKHLIKIDVSFKKKSREIVKKSQIDFDLDPTMLVAIPQTEARKIS